MQELGNIRYKSWDIYSRYKQKYEEKGEEIGQTKCSSFHRSLKTIMDEINSLMESSLGNSELQDVCSTEHTKNVIREIDDELYADIEKEKLSPGEIALKYADSRNNRSCEKADRDYYSKHIEHSLNKVDSSDEHKINPCVGQVVTNKEISSPDRPVSNTIQLGNKRAGQITSSKSPNCSDHMLQASPPRFQTIGRGCAALFSDNDMPVGNGRTMNVSDKTKKTCSPISYEQYVAIGSSYKPANKYSATHEDPAIIDFQFSRLSFSPETSKDQEDNSQYYRQTRDETTRKSMTRSLSSDSSEGSMDGNVVADSGVESDIHVFSARKEKVHICNLVCY